MRKSYLFLAFMATVMCVNAQALKVSSAGNVGIGTGSTTPAQKLHVVGNSLLNGNVGIGRTPSYKLDVNGVGRFGDQVVGIILGTHVVGDGGPVGYVYPAIYHTGSTPMYLGTPSARAYYVYTSYVNYSVACTQNSDSKIKKNIQPCNSMLSKIKDIQSYTYNYTDEYLNKFTSDQRQDMQRTSYGFLAQELQKVFPELVHEDDSTGLLSVNYVGMIPVLTSAINELQQGVENRDSVIDALQQKVASLENILLACCSSTKTQKSMQEFDLNNLTNDNTEELKVYQNAPNPFNESTIINCYIPETIKKAELCIYDMSGSRLKCLTVNERGTTTIQIQAGQLAAGVYTYLLIGDGKNSDAKQMILTK